ncbi:MAG: glycosyltransferase family 2 protein [Nocardiopsaceae bacterium]|nr:glycosyltransferase family 2 protein [Nocardiopsaceae bacterium]
MDTGLLVATIALFAVLVAACLLPAVADSAEDAGDGLTNVEIPRHTKTPTYRPRTWGFFAVSAVLGLCYVGLKRPSIPNAYTDLVTAVATAVTRNPATVNGYTGHQYPATQFLAVGYMVGFAIVCRASLGRRLVIALHAALFIVMSVLFQTLMIVASIGLHWIIGPFGIVATLSNLLIGGLVVIRLTFTTFVLPKATAVPNRRPRWPWDTILAACAVITALACLIAAYAFASEPRNLTSMLQVFLPLYAVSILATALFLPLWLMWWVNRKYPTPGPDRPPLDVIVPAYNEAENIARLLRSVDVAAGRYGGPVRVVLSNDGSTDETEEIARAVFRHYQHARGEVLNGPNRRQAAALNRALAVTDAEIVIRIDADCVMGPDALVYSVPWFRDPRIGSVGAAEEPRRDTVTWFHRLRTLETLYQFKFARVAQCMVDGLVVIPGTFTAFRRAPAMAAGGFPTGMNGEDADLTLHIARLGYRVISDPRIVSYEDVPRSPGEFLEQRTRWSRAGIHVFARHCPFRVGSAGPRIWLWSMRRAFSWLALQAGMVAPVFMLELAAFNGSYRRNVITFFLLYALAGAIPLLISLPLAIRYRRWKSILWMPTWVAYAFLRRLATLESTLSLPTRPVRLGVATATVQHRPAPAVPPAPVLHTWSPET